MIFVVGHGRTGKSFIHSLFDGHPQILQIHCILKFHRWWKLFHCEKMDVFELKNFFESKSNLRHVLFNDYKRPQLGEKTYFGPIYICKDRFWKTFEQYIFKYGLNRKNVFLGLHQAYFECLETRPTSIQFLVENAHNHLNNNDILEDFPNACFIHLIRDPRSSYHSYLRSYRNNSTPNWTSECWKHIYSSFQEANNKLLTLGNSRYLVIKSEDLAQDTELTMRKTIQWISGEWHSILLYSTVGGQEWKTNQRTEGASVEPSFQFEKTKWNNEKLRNREKFGIAFALKNAIKLYDYDDFQQSKIKGFFNYFLFLLIPPREEYFGRYSKLKNWKDLVKAKIHTVINILHYPKRFLLAFRYLKYIE